MEKWVKIKYDYVPKNCKTCMIQGHDEQQCYVEHPELHPKMQEESKVDDEGENRSKQKENGGWIMEQRNTNGGEKKQPEKIWAKDEHVDETYEKNKGEELEEQRETPNSVWSNHEYNVATIKIPRKKAKNQWKYKVLATWRWGEQINKNTHRHKVGTSDEANRKEMSFESESRRLMIKAPELVDELEDQIQHMKERDEDNTLEYNIQQISKAGDLSPRHTNSLKAKRGRSAIPLQDPSELEQFRIKLGFDKALANVYGKVWIFWKNNWEGVMVLDTLQQLTMKFASNNDIFLISLVYARCSEVDKLELWDELEISLIGSKYTWWNGCIEEGCILKRLDRILVNNEFLVIFPATKVHHFIRQGSDHALLHVVCKTEAEPTIKPFRFLNFCTKHQQFTQIVLQNWDTDFVGSPFMEVQYKLKKVKRALSIWSKEVFGNIFQQIATLKDMIRIK
ncbi:hypothetical protein H5410_042802 [Solanum commersonii]|uniref:Uncharacterized protein n=1 Tax=Solanum commersonii TaxID=4109 RepID=A0A9J5XYH5_SOLCO|nr:hypothetical protein H5410_042802 [Solanum commersonii]